LDQQSLALRPVTGNAAFIGWHPQFA